MKRLVNYILEKVSNTKLFEMALDRSNYCDKLFFSRIQIVQNWCLIKYCNMFDEENYNRLHWSKELEAQLVSLQKIKLKSGDKLRATYIELIDKAELDDEDMVESICKDKWKRENLPTESLKIISKEFIKELPNICKYICDPKFDIYNYSYNEI